MYFSFIFLLFYSLSHNFIQAYNQFPMQYGGNWMPNGMGNIGMGNGGMGTGGMANGGMASFGMGNGGMVNNGMGMMNHDMPINTNNIANKVSLFH